MKDWLEEWSFLVFELLTILGMIVTLLSLQSCNYYHLKNAQAADLNNLSFADVKPILDAACARCHGGGLGLGGFSIETYADVMKQVVAGDSSKSEIFIRVNNGSMPLGGPALDQAQIDRIKQWIDQGAKETPDPPPVIPVPPDPVPDPVIEPETSYVADISPILSARCFMCHGNGISSGGLNMDTYDDVMRAVVPFSPNTSPLCVRISNGTMPLGSRALDTTQVNLICDWIAAGAKK